MTPTSIAAVAFDHDGLMFNTEDLYVEVGDEVLRRRGHRLTDELLSAMLGRPSPIAMQIMIDHCQLDATVAELAAESEQIFAEILPTRLAPMPGLMPLLDAVRARALPACVVTSSVQKFITKTLQLASLADRFAFTITADDIQYGKPHPEPYLMAAERFEVAPSQMLVLEDSPVGCQAAVAAGAFVVAVPGPTLKRPISSIRSISLWKTLADPRILHALGSRWSSRDERLAGRDAWVARENTGADSPSFRRCHGFRLASVLIVFQIGAIIDHDRGVVRGSPGADKWIAVSRSSRCTSGSRRSLTPTMLRR